jgi:hypothetical protein
MNNPQSAWWVTWPVAEVAVAILPLFSYPSSQKEHSALPCPQHHEGSAGN